MKYFMNDDDSFGPGTDLVISLSAILMIFVVVFIKLHNQEEEKSNLLNSQVVDMSLENEEITLSLNRLLDLLANVKAVEGCSLPDKLLSNSAPTGNTQDTVMSSPLAQKLEEIYGTVKKIEYYQRCLSNRLTILTEKNQKLDGDLDKTILAYQQLLDKNANILQLFNAFTQQLPQITLNNEQCPFIGSTESILMTANDTQDTDLQNIAYELNSVLNLFAQLQKQYECLSNHLTDSIQKNQKATTEGEALSQQYQQLETEYNQLNLIIKTFLEQVPREIKIQNNKCALKIYKNTMPIANNDIQSQLNHITQTIANQQSYIVCLAEQLGTVDLTQVEEKQKALVNAMTNNKYLREKKLMPTYKIGNIKIHHELALQKITFGSDVLFETNDDELRDTGQDTLASVVNALKNNLQSIQEIQIQGHADIRRPEDQPLFNIDLASRRAITVFSFFSENGINPAEQLMSATTFGEYRPVGRQAGRSYNLGQLKEDNSMDWKMDQNRRVEILLFYKTDNN